MAFCKLQVAKALSCYGWTLDGLSMNPQNTLNGLDLTLDRLSMDPRFTLDRPSIKLFYRGYIDIDMSVDERCRFESKTSLPSIVDNIVTISKRCRYESTIVIDSSKRYLYDLFSVSCASRVGLIEQIN